MREINREWKKFDGNTQLIASQSIKISVFKCLITDANKCIVFSLKLHGKNLACNCNIIYMKHYLENYILLTKLLCGARSRLKTGD